MRNKELEQVVIFFKEELKEFGQIELVHVIKVEAIQKYLQEVIEQNPEFDDLNPQDTDTLETWFSEQIFEHGDTMTDSLFDGGKSLHFPKIEEFKEELFQRWLRKQRDCFDYHFIYKEDQGKDKK